VQGRERTPFGSKMSRLEARSFERVVELFLAHEEEILHPDPRVGISVGLVMVISAIYDLVVMPADLKPWKSLLPRDDVALKAELVRAFLGYLGVTASEADGPSKKAKGRRPRRVLSAMD